MGFKKASTLFLLKHTDTKGIADRLSGRRPLFTLFVSNVCGQQSIDKVINTCML